MISIIAVIGKNNELGYQNKLLWHLPEDLKHFKKITVGHTVVMGRKTFESIGRALPNRKNIIITRDTSFSAPDCETTDNLEALLKQYKNSPEEIFIIGGAQIYSASLPYADKLYLTLMDDAPRADVFFPNYKKFAKILNSEEREENGFKYSFVELIK